MWRMLNNTRQYAVVSLRKIYTAFPEYLAAIRNIRAALGEEPNKTDTQLSLCVCELILCHNMSLGPLFKSTGFCGRLFYKRLFPSRGHWWSFPCQYKRSRANQLHLTTKPSISMELASALKLSPLRWTPYFDVYDRHVAPRPASVSFSCHCYSISFSTFWLKTTNFPFSVLAYCPYAGAWRHKPAT